MHAHPRIVAGIIELGSWCDTEEVQSLWAGLLASACTEGGRDDSNLMFVDLLSKLTASQARLFDYICRKSEKQIVGEGWVHASVFYISVEDLRLVTGISDLHQIDRELDHLRTLGLIHEIHGGFYLNASSADVTPSPLALQMFARCQGSIADPVVFFNLRTPPPPTVSG